MVKIGNKSGFKLIQLIMVIVILGILAAIVIPKFADLATQAKISAGKSGLGAIRSAVAMDYARSAASGKAVFPSTVTTSLFTDSLIPKNPLNNSASVGVVTAAPSGTATSTDGWWYIAASGRVGAYSDGDQDTSIW
ncbi:MAG: hypothetical protein Q8N76_06775 [Candidatus Omnitrophota bacterium]|nr:hypothetical protein [Candidatus Omnitrophota bacterium]